VNSKRPFAVESVTTAKGRLEFTRRDYSTERMNG
jgi:hypothetical protein